MSRQLFELCAADNSVRFSPFVWRARLSLCLKELEFESLPSSFLEKEGFAESGHPTYPVLKDGDKWIGDSWAIAEYLDEAYPDRPSIFGSAEGKAYAAFMVNFSNTQLQGPIFMMAAPEIHALLDEKNGDYFHKTRSERIGMPLEDLTPQREKFMGAFKNNLAPLRGQLGASEYLSGDRPRFPDLVIYAALQWAKRTSKINFLEGEDELLAWRDRMDAWYAEKVKALEADPLL